MQRKRQVREWIANSKIQDTFLPVQKFSRNRLLQKEANLVLRNRGHPASRKLRRDLSGPLLNRCATRKRLCLWMKGSGKGFPPIENSRVKLFRPRSWNWSWDWYAIVTKMNEKMTVQFIGMRWFQNCWKHSETGEHKSFRTKSGINTFYEGSNKTRFECCESPQNSLVYSRAIQGHTGRIMIAPELIGHIAITYDWKDFIFHRSCSHNAKSILETGLVTAGRESKEGRQTIFFTPLNILVKIQMKQHPTRSCKTKKGALPQQLGVHPRCCLLGKVVPRTRSRIAILANEVQCNNRTQSFAGRLHPEGDPWKRRSNTTRKTPNTSACATGNT